jgi:RNA polymerase sigma-70 factor (sigma-E family)
MSPAGVPARPEKGRSGGEQILTEEHDEIRDIYRASASRLMAQVYAMTGDYAEAQDVVQDAFAQLLDRPGRLRHLDSPETWLRTVALNRARSRHRRRLVFERLLRRGLLDPTPTPGLSPDHVALVDALQRLSTAVRETVVLHHIADLPVAEVAQLMGCSVEAVKTRLVRGRRALAEHLLDEPPPDRGDASVLRQLVAHRG